MHVEATPLTHLEAGWRANWLGDRPVAHRLTCHDDHRMATIELHRYPDDTMSLVLPADIAQSATTSDLYCPLIRSGIRMATAEKPTLLRCVLLPEHPLETTLRQAEFRVASQLLRWQLQPNSLHGTIKPRDKQAFTISELPGFATESPSDNLALEQLLAVTLPDSGDLPAIPTSEPHALLTLWNLLAGHTRIVAATTGDDIIGTAVVHTPPESDKGSTVTLEYLGVHPACRRRGVASAIIRNVVKACADRVTGPTVLQATSAHTNSAANAFYRHHGFRKTLPATLWCLR